MAEFTKRNFFIFAMFSSDPIAIVRICRKQKLLDVWFSFENKWMLEMLKMPFLELFHEKGHML